MPSRFSDALFTRAALDGSNPVLSESLAREPGPFEIYVPAGYEPSYAYPLVVWFHDAGGNERELHKLMAQVTDRNALGLALRGERVRRAGGFDWLGGDRPRRRQRLLAALQELRREYHIHTERIVLAGQGSGADAAARAFWEHPEWYGGLALFDVDWKSFPFAPLKFDPAKRDELLGKPTLLDLSINDLGPGREIASQMRATGLTVTFEHGREGEIQRDTWRTLDRWMLGAVCGVPV